MFSMKNRGRLEKRTEEEFDNLFRRLRGLFSQTFDADGQLIIADPNLAVTPVGGLLPFAGSTAPDGYRICDGSAVSRVTYQSLFNVIGTTWGVGDGSTTFNLPDLRQKFLLGKAASGTGNTLGASGGAIDHTHTAGAHTHTITSESAHAHSISSDGGHNHGGATGSDGSHAHTVASHAHEIHIIGGSVNGPVFDQNIDGSTARATPSSTGASEDNSTGSAAPVTDSQGAHTHSVNTAGAHDHGASSGSAGSHDHGGVTGSTSGSTGSNNPPYAVVNYLIFAGV